MQLAAKSVEILSKIGKRSEREIFRAAKRAGVSGSRRMRAEAVRQVRMRKAVKVAAIRKRVAVHSVFATKLEDLSWRIRIDGSPLPITAFRVRQTARGVSFTVNKGKRSLLPGAFLATMPTGHRGAFYRAKGAKHRTVKRGSRSVRTQLPINQQFTSGLSSAFRDQTAREAVQLAGEAEYARTFFRLLWARL